MREREIESRDRQRRREKKEREREREKVRERESEREKDTERVQRARVAGQRGQVRASVVKLPQEDNESPPTNKGNSQFPQCNANLKSRGGVVIR